MPNGPILMFVMFLFEAVMSTVLVSHIAGASHDVLECKLPFFRVGFGAACANRLGQGLVAEERFRPQARIVSQCPVLSLPAHPNGQGRFLER